MIKLVSHCEWCLKQGEVKQYSAYGQYAWLCPDCAPRHRTFVVKSLREGRYGNGGSVIKRTPEDEAWELETFGTQEEGDE